MPYVSVDRPPVWAAGDRIANHYRLRGLRGPALQQETGTFATVESIAVDFQWGLRFLSLGSQELAGTARDRLHLRKTLVEWYMFHLDG